MAALNLIVTDAGRAALVNATSTGTLPIVISQIALGSGTWTPTAAATALNTEIKRISTLGGSAIAPDTIHVSAADTTSDTYDLREIGLYTSGGVLFAIYAQSTPLLSKSAAAMTLISADCVFSGIPAGSITVSGSGFSNPPATEMVMGIAELATQAETNAGTDDSRIVTPLKLANRTATEGRTGLAEIATQSEVSAGTDDIRIVTPLKLAGRLAKITSDVFTLESLGYAHCSSLIHLTGTYQRIGDIVTVCGSFQVNVSAAINDIVSVILNFPVTSLPPVGGEASGTAVVVASRSVAPWTVRLPGAVQGSDGVSTAVVSFMATTSDITSAIIYFNYSYKVAP